MRSLLPALIALVLAAPSAHAAPRLDGAPRTAHAGDVIRFAWSGLASGVREVELELSLDGGRWVRISPEMDARAGGYAWRVPASASGIARVRLRSGGEWFERVAAETPAFPIAGSSAFARPGSGDEWWDVHVAGRRPPRPEIARRHADDRGALAAEEDGRPAAEPTAALASRRMPGRGMTTPLALPSAPRLPSTLHLPLRI